ncbi:hypothetical protein OXPF_27580 [Oxobacter pfennigii]|uniref:Uncharacterized protein n=1 Tax=Oxobacter pfennigii TaxID=36849 RepID=A0A0P8WLL0_9CLOT|nr:hypothetical protein [Oxobacter pfennigii]KPU43317.1 hypothetical protein OXPF_27580 [Oxobacter pfennigii]
MRYVGYKQVKFIRLVTACICLGFMAAALFKLYYNYSKIESFKKGEEFYNEGRVVDAEEWLMKAKQRTLFEYNEDRLSERLGELKDVTNLKAFMEDLSKNIKKANESKDVEHLIDEYNRYIERYGQESEKGEGTKAVFEEISKNYKIEDNLEKYFAAAKDALKARAENNIKSKEFQNEDFKDTFLKMPAVYYGGEENKKEEVDKLIKDYDYNKIDIIALDKGISAATSEAQNIILSYKKNSRDYKWVIDKMESLWGHEIDKDINALDYNSLYGHYREYESFIGNYLTKSKVLAAVDSQIRDDYNRANKYSDEGNFSEAMTIYKNISQFKDVQPDMNSTQIKWIEKEPLVALNTVFPDKRFIMAQSGVDTWGSTVFALGCDDEGELVLVKVSEDCKYTAASAKIEDYNDNLKSIRTVKELDYNGPSVIVELSSDNREALYIGLAVLDTGFKEIFKLEADSLTIESPEQLLVDNPVGEGEGGQCYYILKDGYYSFDKIKDDFTLINLRDIDNYRGKKIKFFCNVLEYDNFRKEAIGRSGDTYVFLRNFRLNRTGSMYITGVYTEESRIYGEDGPVTIPSVNVLDAE